MASAKAFCHAFTMPWGMRGALMDWHYSFGGEIATPAWSKAGRQD
jgi:hypothetical protein